MRIIITLILLIIAGNGLGQVKKINTTSTISDVTVFSSGARVTRTSSVSILPGRTEIIFKGLSNQLDRQSVQLKANENITLLSVQATRDFITERKLDTDEKQFNIKMGALQDTVALDKKMLEVYQNEENMLIKNEAIGGNSGVTASALKAALDLHRQRLTEVYRKQLEIQNRIRNNEKHLAILKAQLQEFSKKRDSINYIVTALIESKQAAKVHFELLYNVQDAGWYPTYNVRVQEVSKPLEVLMNANVYQRSGENWKNVSLILSTGNPKENATPSQLHPWRLNFYDPSINYRRQMQQGTASGRLSNERGEPIAGATMVIIGTNKGTVTDVNGFYRLSGFPINSNLQVSAVGYHSKTIPLVPGYTAITLRDAANKLEQVVVTGYLRGMVAGAKTKNLKEEESIQPVNSTTQYQPTTTVYRINEKYTIETDGKTTTIGIKDFDIPASYEYYTTPKTDASAFLKAKIADWQEYDLQSGEASLFFEGAYLGKTYIDMGTVDDTLSLSLGKDNGIKVTRKSVKEFSSKHFIGSNKTESRQFEISLRNTRQSPIRIIVKDQFPVSVTKEISVNDKEAPGAQINEETGIITWEMTLNPGEEKKLTLSYSVKYPKGKRVIVE